VLYGLLLSEQLIIPGKSVLIMLLYINDTEIWVGHLTERNKLFTTGQDVRFCDQGCFHFFTNQKCFAWSVTFHIVIYSKDLICKRQQHYILLKKILIFYILFVSVDKTDEGYHCVCSIYLSLFIVYGYVFLGIIFC